MQKQRDPVVESAVIVIDMISVQTLLTLFSCVLGKTLFSIFPCLAVLVKSSKFQSYIYKTKKQIKNFNWIAISWHFRKRVGVVTAVCITPPSLSC